MKVILDLDGFRKEMDMDYKTYQWGRMRMQLCDKIPVTANPSDVPETSEYLVFEFVYSGIDEKTSLPVFSFNKYFNKYG